MLLSGFPREIIEQIANYLSFRDKTSCSLVCKSWKRLFQDTLYSDISILSDDAIKTVMNPSHDNRHKYHEIGHLVRYLTISKNFNAKAKGIYALQKTFPNIKYLYFAIASLRSNDFGSIPNWNLWRSLTELRMDIDNAYKTIKENSVVEAIACLPLLRRLSIQNKIQVRSIASFSVNNLETIHSHLKHLEYMRLGTDLLTLSDTDLERIPNVSPATTLKTLGIVSDRTDYRWLCYLARKYPNLHTLELDINYLLTDIEVQRRSTMALFQQVPISFKRLTKLKCIYSSDNKGGNLFFMDKINFHDAPLKHIRIITSLTSGPFADYLCAASNTIVETILERCSKTIESIDQTCNRNHTTTITLTGMENSLCNLVKLDLSIFTVADIDTFLRAAPRLKYLKLLSADIKVKDEFYNSERFELQSFGLRHSTITSDVLRFLSFHCRKLDTLSLVKTSVYGSFTTLKCQSIDMTYSRLETLSIENTRFIIKGSSKECPNNLNITLITRPVDDIPPKQEYDPNILPVNVGDTPFKTRNDWFYEDGPDNMFKCLGSQASYVNEFLSKYAEIMRFPMQGNFYRRRISLTGTWSQNFVYEYTKISLGYVSNYTLL
ncbi:hypothetical protein CLU79DRAFT_155055 [Phycomyces nitens]|nr:hypothetical protein CLU79DRAFT_155055 [Phycomyces nitens]